MTSTITRKGDWLDPTLRAWIISTRPWSVPASLIPVFLTAIVLINEDALEPSSLLGIDFILMTLGVISVHFAGNLINTYFDFKKGIDTKASADDRTLVDGFVSPTTVKILSFCCLGLAATIGLYFYLSIGNQILLHVLLGGALTVFYTADPLSLKCLGLGDVVIFLCFGPLLMQGCAIVLIGETSRTVLLYSIIWGLLTENILHANNARDIETDRKAGARTLAQFIGRQNSFYLYVLFFFLSYAMVALISLESGAPQLLLAPAVSLPWTAYLIRCFHRGFFTALPQKTAQHNLLFGAVLCMALTPILFQARLLLGCLFYLGGVNNILMWRYNSKMVTMKIQNVFGSLTPEWLCSIGLQVAIGMQLVASIAFIFGWHARLAAQILLVFLLPVTLIIHDFWTVEEEGQFIDKPAQAVPGAIISSRYPVFLGDFDNQFVHFFKNVGMMGGLLLYIACEQ